MAFCLAEAGAHVIVNGRNRRTLEEFVVEIEARKGSAEPAAFDVGDLAAARKFFAARPRLDILVNNAIAMTPKPFDALAESDFEQTYRTGVVAPFEMARAALPAMRAAVREAGEASIVNIASMYGAVSPDARVYSRPEQASPFHYGPAKAALLQLTRHLAAELAKEHIRVNALVPGPFPRDSVAKSGSSVCGAIGRAHHAGPGRARGRNPRTASFPCVACVELRHRSRACSRWRLDRVVG